MESTVASLQACPHCGALNRPRLHFCLSCGGRLAAADAPQAPPDSDKPRSVLEKIEAAKKEVESALGPLTVNPPVTVSPGTYESQRYSPVPPESPRRSRPGLWTGIAVAVLVALIGSWLYTQYGAQGRHVGAAPAASDAPAVPAEPAPAPAATAAPPAPAPTQSAEAMAPPASTEAAAPQASVPAAPVAEAPRHEAPRKVAKPKARAAKTETPAVAAPSPAPETPAPAPASAPVKVEPAAPTLAQKVAQCRALGFFEKERCLWSICSGHWGKDGCPAYQQPRREPGG